MRPATHLVRRPLLGKLDFCAIIQSVNPVVDNGFTQFQARKNGRTLSVDGPRLDHPDGDGRIGIDQINIRSRRTKLDRRGRDDDRIL